MNGTGTSKWIARAHALLEVIEADAASAEAATTTTPRVVAALADAELYWILVPRELGGAECSILEAIEVFETLAYADGSTGWSAMANITTSCLASIYTSDEAAKTMFAPGEMGIHAGMLGPVGTAIAAEDGFIVSGKYQFGSGCPHATWIGAGAIERDRHGEPTTDAFGIPVMHVAFLRSDQVLLRGNWNVLGLASTGSYDYTVDDEFVGSGFTFPLLSATPQRGGPHYQVGLFAVVASGHAGMALGAGQRALDEVLKLAQTKTRMGRSTSVVSDPQFQLEYAMHDATLRAARAYVFEAFGDAEAVAVSGAVPSPVQEHRLRQATTYATRVAADAARFAYLWAGASALRNDSVVQRCFRDLHAATQHIYVDNQTLTGYTQALGAQS